MGKMKAKKEETTETKKWDRQDFLKAFYLNRGDRHLISNTGNEELDNTANWESFHQAMNAACEADTKGGSISHNVLSMRCGAAVAYFAKAVKEGKIPPGEVWTYPTRPKKKVEKPETIAELMARIASGQVELEVDAV